MEPTPSVSAAILRLGGTPTLLVGGEPHPGIGYLTFHPEARGRFRDFYRAGIRLVAFNATCNFHSYGTAMAVEPTPRVFDPRGLDRRVGRILRQIPDAILVVRVYVGSPPWWDALHRAELMRFEDGGRSRTFLSGPLKRTVPSFSSRRWRGDAASSLARLVRHIRSSPYGGRVIGFQLMGGETEEWFYHGTYEGYLSDYSAPHERAFRAWQKERARELGGPWRRFRSWSGGGHPVPHPARRAASGDSALLDPASERDVAEYVLFRSREVAETIVEFADVVKEASEGHALCGAFYGYLLELASHPMGLPHGGHLSFARVLTSPSIDFLSSPASYLNRGVGSGYSAFMTVTDSARLHGKLWFNENDSRTHLTPPAYECGRTSTVLETTSVMRREFAHSMARGVGLWWFDMRGGWYRDPENMTEAARLNRLAHSLVRSDRRSAAEVAVLVDGEALRYFRAGNPISRLLLGSQIQELGRTGAPFDCFLLGDLDSLESYRVYLVLSPLDLDPKMRRRIRRVLRSQRRTTIWVYAPDAVQGDAIRDEGVSEMTGMTVRRFDAGAEAIVHVLPGSDPALRGLETPIAYGVPEPMQPLFVASGNVRALGRFDGTGEVGLAVRETGGWTSVFSSVPCIPAPVLRALFRWAGVHLWIEGGDCVVYGNRSFLALHSGEEGPRTVRLPGERIVRDADTGRVIGASVREFVADLPARHTALYRLDPLEDGESV